MRLSVENLSAGYGRIRVLHGISINVDQGSSVGLFGPNGHGKTTLLRSISGIIPVEQGVINFAGQDMRCKSSHQIVDAGLIHVPQGSTLLPRMTVIETLTLGAFPNHAWVQRNNKLQEVFDIFPRLAERRHQNCNTLSGGERQMAAIGVGLMGCPKLLMLDEPTLGLAPRIRQELAEQIGRVAQTGVTLVIVDQDVDLLLKLCPRLYLIEQGTVSLEIKDRDELSHQDVINRYFGNAA
jgi:branched-chain amino acid transport system ATP-binding protein|tara:strand:- start:1112 stop:1825 length:714 start_codon:yes stop_codon:yes gene_type:complete